MSEPPRYQCTAETPWRPEYGTAVEHDTTREVPDSQRDNYPCGDLITMACQTCGHRWQME